MPRTKKTKSDDHTQEPAAAGITGTAAPGKKEKPSVLKHAEKDTPEKEVLIQYGGGEWSVADLEEKAIAAYVAEGHRRGRISKLKVYLKPEERKIYYVVNDKTTGSTEFE